MEPATDTSLPAIAPCRFLSSGHGSTTIPYEAEPHADSVIKVLVGTVKRLLSTFDYFVLSQHGSSMCAGFAMGFGLFLTFTGMYLQYRFNGFTFCVKRVLFFRAYPAGTREQQPFRGPAPPNFRETFAPPGQNVQHGRHPVEEIAALEEGFIINLHGEDKTSKNHGAGLVPAEVIIVQQPRAAEVSLGTLAMETIHFETL